MMIRLKEVIISERITHLIKSTPVNLPRYRDITEVEAEVAGLEGEIVDGTILCRGRVGFLIEGIAGEGERSFKVAARCSEIFEFVKGMKEAANVDRPMLDIRAEVVDIYIKSDMEGGRLDIFCVVELSLVLFRFIPVEISTELVGQGGSGQGTVPCLAADGHIGMGQGMRQGTVPLYNIVVDEP